MDERFWMELTDRSDLGGELWNFQEGEAGRIPSTALLDEMSDGDVVFHYVKAQHAVVGVSRVTGRAAIRARQGGRAIIAREIEDYTPVSSPVALADVRVRSTAVFAELERLKSAGRAPHFLPFVRDPWGGRPAQAYISRFPAVLVQLLGLPDETGHRNARFGKRLAGPRPRPKEVTGRDPFPTDPDKADRGTQAHHDAEEALRSYVAAEGGIPVEPVPGEPSYDLGWSVGPHRWLAEVKSVTAANEERQLRYGLGQLLQYGHALSYLSVKLVLVTEREPADSRWTAVCASREVLLTWPAAFDRRLVSP
jgi:hypothetical protein